MCVFAIKEWSGLQLGENGGGGLCVCFGEVSMREFKWACVCLCVRVRICVCGLGERLEFRKKGSMLSMELLFSHAYLHGEPSAPCQCVTCSSEPSPRKLGEED